MIYDIIFPPAYSYGAMGGCGWSTRVVTTDSGIEYRQQMWSATRGEWHVGHNLRSPADWSNLVAFHRAVQGKLIGFRFQDWIDYTHELGPQQGWETGALLAAPHAPGSGYAVNDTITLTAGGVTIITPPTVQVTSVGAGGTILTVSVVNRGNVTGFANPLIQATQASTSGSGTGGQIALWYTAGIVQMNPYGNLQLAKWYPVQDIVTNVVALATRFISKPVPGTITFQNTTGSVVMDYTSGLISAGADTSTTWQGQFHVPTRFDVDRPDVSLDLPAGAGWRGIPIVEVRQKSPIA